MKVSGRTSGKRCFAIIRRFSGAPASDNPITGWYMSLCDGMQRTAQWHVFWRGVDAARVPDLVAEALARPADFGAEPG